ncbi:rhamnan synthesis protein F [Microterricola gilva]|uniref:Rhamnan synthesis protein F n=1 Tax=Microterricola gilva TaxID=393267 RepID=A0A4Q8AIQ2_9MICO|nr:glycoside hydrolase family 99-like domain-containing protein [Microterricola gilva]RZU64350.1 rhamnan synthesis protein F [Microterricola gilva]
MRDKTLSRIKRGAGRGFAVLANALAEPPAAQPDTSHPADFTKWVERRTGRLRAKVPFHWASSVTVPSNPERVAVLLHVYYTDLVPGILDELESLPVPFDLIVTNASGEPLELDTSSLPLLSHLVVLDIENHGRDILPMIAIVNTGMLDPYELVLKVHTKKSEWREGHSELSGSGDEWRQEFYSALLGSRENVESILNVFAENPAVGLMTSPGNVVGPEFWGGDKQLTAELLRRLELELDEESLRFASGSIYWVRGFLLQGLRALNLDSDDFDVEAGQVDGTTAHAIERILGILTMEAGYTLAETTTLSPAGDHGAWQRFGPTHERSPRARVVPFYLPQFHTYPENDAWWGHGFTEWSNVAAAQPVFLGHNQPFLPADLGFYDLASDDVRGKQYELATEAGIEGFMYYYYWFAGRKLMNMPVESLLDGDADEPFCIMWANENWTRRWDGGEKNVLIGQDYDKVPATQFIHDVLPLITDPRYIRVDGMPLLAVYRITQIPDFESVISYWREVAVAAGLPGLTLVTVDVGKSMDGIEGDLAAHGLDAFLEFAPHNRKWTAQRREDLGVDPRLHGNILSYRDMVSDSELVLREPVDANRFPGVMVNFDNTARRQWQPDLWYGSNPYTFRRWLNSAVSAVSDRDRDRRLVFLNAWNEWAEGAVLEPSQRFGHTYLLAVRDVLYR